MPLWGISNEYPQHMFSAKIIEKGVAIQLNIYQMFQSKNNKNYPKLSKIITSCGATKNTDLIIRNL